MIAPTRDLPIECPDATGSISDEVAEIIAAMLLDLVDREDGTAETPFPFSKEKKGWTTTE